MVFAFLIGRILFGGFFLKNAYKHLVKTNAMVGYAASKGVPSPALAIRVSGVLLLIGGLSMIFGVYTFWGAIAIALFLIPVSFKMHPFWKVQDPMGKMGECVQFDKNMALLGAALMTMAIATPWLYSL